VSKRGDFGRDASVAFGLWTGLHRCRLAPRKSTGSGSSSMGGGWKGVEIHRHLLSQYGDNALPQRSLHGWTEMYKNGWTNVTDAERSGRRSTSTSDDKQEQDRAMILDDRRTGTLQHAKILLLKVQPIQSCMTFLDTTRFVQGGCQNLWQKIGSAIVFYSGTIKKANIF
jgi:hypothetical protein